MPWVIPTILGIIIGVIGTLFWLKKKWSAQLRLEHRKHQKVLSQREAEYQQRLADTQQSLQRDYDNRIQEVTNELAMARKKEAEAKVKVLQTDYHARLAQVTEEIKRSHKQDLAIATERLKQEEETLLQTSQEYHDLSSPSFLDQSLTPHETAPESVAAETESILSPEALHPLDSVTEAVSFLEPEPIHPALPENLGMSESEVSQPLSANSPQINAVLSDTVDAQPNESAITNLEEPILQTDAELDSIIDSSPSLEVSLSNRDSNHNADQIDLNLSEQQPKDLSLSELITPIEPASLSAQEDDMLSFATLWSIPEEEALNLEDLDTLLDSAQVAELEFLMDEGDSSSPTTTPLNSDFDFSDQSFEPEISALTPAELQADLEITFDQEVGEKDLEQTATFTGLSPDIPVKSISSDTSTPSESRVLSNDNYLVHEIKFFQKDGELYVALFDNPSLFHPEFWIKNMQAKELGIQQLPENITLENKYPVERLGFDPFIVAKPQV